MRKTVVLAMSGGVDSSVAAHLLKRRGYSVVGITFKLWPKSLCGSHGAKSCCSLEAINDARSVCANLGIPHYVLDCERLFKKEVIDYFLRSYESHLTPNPCIVCNERIKFPLLLKKAKELDFKYIATGHHARCIFDRRQKLFFIKEGKDKNKDQSYFLFSLPQGILSRLLLPVGDFKKERIRLLARNLGFGVAEKKESQEICFIPDNNLEGFLKANLCKKIMPGRIIDKEGKVLGVHNGSLFFTIGQRKGIRIPFGKPIYVIDIKHNSNDIVVGEHKDTFKSSIIINNAFWTVKVNVKKPFGCRVKIRYRHPKSPASIRFISNDSCMLNFLNPQSSPTPGQAAVFYRRDTVIGGGWIRQVR